jgi:hypothetical protein
MAHAPAVLAALLLIGLLAGCTTAPRDAPRYRAEEHGTLVQGTLTAAGVVVAGLALEERTNHAALRLGPVEGVAPWAALVVEGASVGGARGTLFVRGPDLTMEGPLAFTASAVGLAPGERTLVLAAGEAGPRHGLGEAPAGTDAGAWREAHDARFFADPVRLRAEGPLQVAGSSLRLATSDGLRDLGTSARLDGAASFAATAQVWAALPPAPVEVLHALGPRVQVSLAGPRGTLDLGPQGARDLAEATVLDGRAPGLRLTPQGDAVRAEVALVAFQVYHGGAPLLPARVVVEPVEAAISLQDGRGAAGVRVREAGGDHDAVFAAVRTGGQGNVTFPGFTSVWESWPPELRLLMVSGPWAINFAFANVVMEGLRLLTGQYLPQPLQAGQQKDVQVHVEGAPPGGEGWVALEGRNFPAARLVLRYR